MLHKNCQVCGNPMYSEAYFGSDADSSLNSDFCSNCYRGGQFYNKNWEGTLSGPSMPFTMGLMGRNTSGGGFGI